MILTYFSDDYILSHDNSEPYTSPNFDWEFENDGMGIIDIYVGF